MFVLSTASALVDFASFGMELRTVFRKVEEAHDGASKLIEYYVSYVRNIHTSRPSKDYSTTLITSKQRRNMFALERARLKLHSKYAGQVPACMPLGRDLPRSYHSSSSVSTVAIA